MSRKSEDQIWVISLLLIGMSTVVLAGANVVGIVLGDVVTRILGIIDLVILPVLLFMMVRKLKAQDKE
ncbi:MAG: hypothetical protein K2I47_04965 [Odoribacter sp.]|nr:hypothetical protein [Odoribacter sp.]